LRPRGPSVERTALANFETPANRGWRASSSNTICFATLNSLNDEIRPDLAVGLSGPYFEQSACQRARKPGRFLRKPLFSKALGRLVCLALALGLPKCAESLRKCPWSGSQALLVSLEFRLEAVLDGFDQPKSQA
jgi:hypothetical protein